jgi:hypothetical protein
MFLRSRMLAATRRVAVAGGVAAAGVAAPGGVAAANLFPAPHVAQRRHSSGAPAPEPTAAPGAPSPDTTEDIIGMLGALVGPGFDNVSGIYASLAPADRTRIRRTEWKTLSKFMLAHVEHFELTSDLMQVRQRPAHTLSIELVEEAEPEGAVADDGAAPSPSFVSADPEAAAAEEAPAVDGDAGAPAELAAPTLQPPTVKSNPPAKKASQSVPLSVPRPGAFKDMPAPPPPESSERPPAKKVAATRRVVVAAPPPVSSGSLFAVEPGTSKSHSVESNADLKKRGAAIEVMQDLVNCKSFNAIREGRVFTPPPAPSPNDGHSAFSDNEATSSDLRTSDQVLATAMTTQMFVPYIPTFFVPMDVALTGLPDGYEEAHVEQIASATLAIQIVTVLGKRFVRLHGGDKNKSLVSFFTDEAREDAALVAERYAQYKPDPTLARHFVDKLMPRGKWSALYPVVMSAPEAAVKGLPFEGPATLLYFAQMQHCFAFSPLDGGGVCVPAQPITNLTWESSPTPMVCHGVMAVIILNPVPIEEVFALMPKAAQDDLMAFYRAEAVVKQAAMTSASYANPLRGWARRPAGGAAAPAAAAERNDFAPTGAGRQGTDAAGDADGDDHAAIAAEEEAAMRRGTDDDCDGDDAEEDHIEGDDEISAGSSPSAARDAAAAPQATVDPAVRDTGSMPEGGTAATAIAEQIDCLRRFVESHAPLFGFKHGTQLIMMACEVEADRRQHMSLEDQLKEAMDRNDSKKFKKLKRKMLVVNSPDNPLLDEAFLAKTLLEFLPMQRPISIRSLREMLPSEVLDLLPYKGKKFYMKYPEYFKLYEIGFAGKCFLQRAELEAPAGALRAEGTFSDDEIVRVVAQQLTMGGRSTITGLQTRLPIGVEKTLTKRWGGLAQMVQAFPENFVLVIKDPLNKDIRTATVTLIRMPE